MTIALTGSGFGASGFVQACDINGNNCTATQTQGPWGGTVDIWWSIPAVVAGSVSTYCLEVTENFAGGALTSGCYLFQVAAGPPVPTVALRKFQWGAAASGGLAQLWQNNSNWTQDKLADEGGTLVTNPAWVAGSGGGSPNENDPVAYVAGATPGVGTVVITRSDGASGSATLHIASNQSAISFPDTQIQFQTGMATLSAVLAQNALPSAVANMGLMLTWSVALSDGRPVPNFAQTTHNVFVSLAVPQGFTGGAGFTSAPHVTAKRVNYVTGLLNGQTDTSASATKVQQSVYNAFGAGSETLGDVYGSMNPWVALDAPMSGVNYFFGLTTTISPCQRQLPFDS